MSSPLLMGVVNVTPDSFSDGGRYFNANAAIARGIQLARDGADILDIGGESTRPGAAPVPLDVELQRVMPVVAGLAGQSGSRISIDTRKPEVARAAAAAGAVIWNDVSALTYSPESVEAAASLGCEIVLMHAKGDPKTMQDNPIYDDVVEEVFAFLAARVEACTAAGVRRERIVVDPGFGFGKTVAHNLALLARLDRFLALDCPVLIGVSRKRFIAAASRSSVEEGLAPETERLGGSLAAVLAARARGASIFRVHDVSATRQALSVFAAIEKAKISA